MSTDPSRPRLHLTPQGGWINDPLGLTVRGAEWHVFFQFVPDQVRWSPEQRWGHATSNDGLVWSEAPDAWTYAGAAVIIASGTVLVLWERQAKG